MSLAEGSGISPTEESKAEVLFRPPLYVQRAALLRRLMLCYQCHTVVDAGCSEGTLLRYVVSSRLQQQSLDRVVAIDLDASCLRAAQSILPFPPQGTAYLRPLRVELIQGDLTVPPPEDDSDWLSAPLRVDMVYSIEVLEHISPPLVAAFTDTLFAHLGAAHGAQYVVLTTPNREENGRFETTEAAPPPGWPLDRSIYSKVHRYPRRRHPEHFFELTRQQFLTYCDTVIQSYAPYWHHYELIEVGDYFSQGAVFHRGTSREGQGDALKLSREERLAQFPFEAVFGMTLETYQKEEEEEKEEEVSPPSTVEYIRLFTNAFSWSPLWSRLCALCSRCYEAVQEGVHASSRRRCSTPRSSLAPSGVRQCVDVHTFGDFIDLSDALEQEPFDASIAAFGAAIEEQLRLWETHREEKKREWSRLAKRLRLPVASAYYTAGGTPELSSSQVRHDSEAQAQLRRRLPLKEWSASAEEALRVLDQLLQCETAVPLLHWIRERLEEEVRRLPWEEHRAPLTPVTSAYGATTSVKKSISDWDEYRDGLKLSPELRGVLFFTASVDCSTSSLHCLTDAKCAYRIRVLCSSKGGKDTDRRRRIGGGKERQPTHHTALLYDVIRRLPF